MDIFELALEREIYMCNLYKELASKSKSIGFKNIFTMMAQEEGKHVDIFNTKRNQIPHEELKDYFVEAKNLFDDIKSKEKGLNEDQEQIWLYCKIRDLEEENMKFYKEAAQKTSNEKLKAIYLEFAEEELRHYEMMEEIVDYVGRPLTWVSCAETSSLRTY